MKKLRIFFLFVLLCLSLCGCGRDDEVTAGNIPNSTESTEQTTSAPITVTLTFPEGYTAKEIAEKLEEGKVCTAKEFMALIGNAEYIKALPYKFIEGIENADKRPFVLEGYIFPDTYEFYIAEGAEGALGRFLDNTELKLKSEYYSRAEEIGYSLDEMIALASIIQEEASETNEMPKVSSVLHNRLESPDYGMLQCDVTIFYLNDNIKDSPYTAVDVDSVKEYYDTYTCVGLPVGPICNVGLAAIEAALYPAETNYFYFVTDEQWNYHYSETYEEHLLKCEEIGLW